MLDAHGLSFRVPINHIVRPSKAALRTVHAHVCGASWSARQRRCRWLRRAGVGAGWAQRGSRGPLPLGHVLEPRGELGVLLLQIDDLLPLLVQLALPHKTTRAGGGAARRRVRAGGSGARLGSGRAVRERCGERRASVSGAGGGGRWKGWCERVAPASASSRASSCPPSPAREAGWR